MSIERLFYCDWRECECHARTASTDAPAGYLTVTQDADRPLHFCTWDCLLKYSAEKPPVETGPFAALG